MLLYAILLNFLGKVNVGTPHLLDQGLAQN